MSFLGFGKKKEEAGNNVSNIKGTEKSCCCGGDCSTESFEKAAESITGDKSVKVLGSGCANCNKLEENVKKALEQLGMDTTIEHVTDFSVIAAYGVMTTPALVVDGKVVAYGKVLSVDEAVSILKKVR